MGLVVVSFTEPNDRTKKSSEQDQTAHMMQNDPGPNSPTILKNILCLCFQDL